MKTPGVYIVEKNAFPNSIVEVATAVPAFVGYTNKADNRGASLSRKPFRISSMAEYTQYFGGAPATTFKIEEPKAPEGGGDAPAPEFTVGDKGYVLTPVKRWLLYYSMRHFFQNGGGPCYVVSVGPDTTDVPDLQTLMDGVDALQSETEPTMLVIPDAMGLAAAGQCYSLQQHMLMHCGDVMKNRVAILDVYNGDKDKNSGDPVGAFRNGLGVNHLRFGAAYYPWLHTTILQDRDISYTDFAGGDANLTDLIKAELQAQADAEPEGTRGGIRETLEAMERDSAAWTAAAGTYWTDNLKPLLKPGADEGQEKAKWLALNSDPWIQQGKAQVNQTLFRTSDLFATITRQAARHMNLLPSSPAMAGLYTMVDNSRGVWKAPANVSVNGATAPAVSISHADQEDLNVTATGKSINAIRSFIGEGVLVWGARTLDGNSLDWRYINVRRTMIMLEESCRLAAKAMVFEPNVANTWETIRAMIQNFLSGIWKRGGLAGAVPEDAFAVYVGLGETMTPEDILEGILRVTVLVAVSRPAEFIEITFQQQMQKS